MNRKPDPHSQTLWLNDDETAVCIIDQTKLPFARSVKQIHTLPDFCRAIVNMEVRGAPLIGITAAFGYAFALNEGQLPEEEIAAQLMATRPTAVNLHWAVARVTRRIAALPKAQRPSAALDEAKLIWQEDMQMCHAIGEYGLHILKNKYAEKKRPINILTHCNAGWLATGKWGTALAPIYKAHEQGLPLHVWVDETRPRNQGYLTSWELTEAGVPHTLVVDNAGGHLMQHGKVDLCIVGSDRTTAGGDVCNKIGTYLKALAARASQIPFYVALPTSTIDWSLQDGVREIPIEERDNAEINSVVVKGTDGRLITGNLMPDNIQSVNFAFDVTPANYVTALITEKGIFNTTPNDLLALKALCQTPSLD